MQKRLLFTLTITHAIALGAGAYFAFSQAPEEDQKKPRSARSRTSAAREKRVVSTDDLIAAYNDTKFSNEASKRRYPNRQGTEKSSDRGKTSEELAATVKEYRLYMDEAVRRMNEGRGSNKDPLYGRKVTPLVFAKWLEENPDHALAWLGDMDCEAAWIDLYKMPLKTAFADNPSGFYDVISNGWKDRNRKYALRELARHCARSASDQISPLLDKLDEKERSGFIIKAAASSQPKDWEMWLALVEDQRLAPMARSQVLNTLEIGLIQFKNDELSQICELVIAASEGKFYEEKFKSSYIKKKAVQEEAELSRNLNELSQKDPVAAFAKWVELKKSHGMTDEDARTWVLSRNLGEHEIDPYLQRASVGDSSISEALTTVRKQYQHAPKDLLNKMSKRWYHSALIVDPVETINHALSNNEETELYRGLDSLLDTYQRRGFQHRQTLMALMATEAWGKYANAESNLADELRSYHAVDPKAARSWAQSLPTKEQRSYAEKILAEESK